MHDIKEANCMTIGMTLRQEKPTSAPYTHI